jgi:uncharacterized membrane protein (DUF485 family)
MSEIDEPRYKHRSVIESKELRAQADALYLRLRAFRVKMAFALSISVLASALVICALVMFARVGLATPAIVTVLSSVTLITAAFVVAFVIYHYAVGLRPQTLRLFMALSRSAKELALDEERELKKHERARSELRKPHNLDPPTI